MVPIQRMPSPHTVHIQWHDLTARSTAGVALESPLPDKCRTIGPMALGECCRAACATQLLLGSLYCTLVRPTAKPQNHTQSVHPQPHTTHRQPTHGPISTWSPQLRVLYNMFT